VWMRHPDTLYQGATQLRNTVLTLLESSMHREQGYYKPCLETLNKAVLRLCDSAQAQTDGGSAQSSRAAWQGLMDFCLPLLGAIKGLSAWTSNAPSSERLSLVRAYINSLIPLERAILSTLVTYFSTSYWMVLDAPNVQQRALQIWQKG